MHPHRLFTLLVTLILLTPLCRAQPLADRVPDDAMIYAGWVGVDSLGDPYQSSHLRAIVDSSDWPAAFRDFLPALLNKANQNNPANAQRTRVLSAMTSAAWHHESAFYFGGLIPGQRGGPPSPKLALLIRAGATDAPALAKQLNDTLQRAGHTPFPLKADAHGDLLAVTSGAWPAFESLLGAQNNTPAAPSLKTNNKFTTTVTHVQKSPLATLYVDAEALVKMTDGLVALTAKPQDQRNWRHLRQILGLGGLKQSIWAGGFDGKDWATECFLGAPSPRPGLLALLDPAPVPDDILKLVPQDATTASACHADLSAALSRIRKSLADADPDLARQFDQAIAHFNQQVGLDLDRDLLATLGPDWASSISPTVGGNGVLGLCIVNHPKDPQKADASFTTLATHLTTALQQQPPGKPTLAFKTRQLNDLTLHYLALPLVTPAWTISDGNLYVALYPQVILSAVASARRNGPSLLQNDHFTAALARVGHRDSATALSFSDLPRSAPSAYPAWLALSHYIGLTDLIGVDSPILLLPPLDRLMPELAPAAETRWTDDDGWHSRSVSPFPGSTAIAQDPLGTILAAEPATLSVLLPALHKARANNATRVAASKNLHQIGQAMFAYADAHGHKLPPTLGDLAAGRNLPPSLFLRPGSPTPVPATVTDKARLTEWVNENADYLYLAADKPNTQPPDAILAYEKLEANANAGTNVLFGDGHVEWVNSPEAMQRIQAQQAKDRKSQ